MFCLDPVKRNEVAFNPIGCSCQFKSHGNCLHEWFEQKHQYECPICHTISIPNPTQQQVVRFVYVEEAPQYNSLIDQRHQKCIGFCCLTLVGWSLIMTILDLIFRTK